MQLINAYAGCLFSATQHVDRDTSQVPRRPPEHGHRSPGTDSLTCGKPIVWALATGPNRRFTALDPIAVVFPAETDGTAAPGSHRIHTVSQAALDQSVSSLRVLLQGGDGALARAALHLTAVHASESYAYNQALVDALFVAEAILGDWWRQYIDTAAAGALPRGRRELLEGRDYTASVRSEVLQLAGRLSPDLYERLGQVRKLRNKAAHALQPIAHDEAATAVALAGDMLTERYNAPLSLMANPSLSL